MNEKAGLKELSSAIIIFSLSPVVLFLIANICGKLNAGAWINFMINSIYVFAVILILSNYFNKFSTNIVETTKHLFGSNVSVFVGILYLILIFVYTSFNFGMYSDSVMKLGFFSYSKEYVSLLPVIAAIICAYWGMEGNTRIAYTVFFIALAITIFCVFSTFKAWDRENMFPILGMNSKTTFFSMTSLCAYPGLGVLFLVNGYLGNKTEMKKCLKRCFFGVFLAGFAVCLIYILSVPYPVNKDYTFLAEGFFSSTLSGDVFHRFEIFLISANIFFDICATSFGILVCALLIAELVGAKDFRPYVLILGVMTFYMSSMSVSVERYITFCIIMTAVLFFFPALCIALSYKNRNGREV